MVTPLLKNPCPGVMKFTILVHPSLVITLFTKVVLSTLKWRKV